MAPVQNKLSAMQEQPLMVTPLPVLIGLQSFPFRFRPCDLGLAVTLRQDLLNHSQ